MAQFLNRSSFDLNRVGSTPTAANPSQAKREIEGSGTFAASVIKLEVANVEGSESVVPFVGSTEGVGRIPPPGFVGELGKIPPVGWMRELGKIPLVDELELEELGRIPSFDPVES